MNRTDGAALFEFERKVKAGHFLNTGRHFVCENLDRISREGWEGTYAFLTNCTAHGVTVITYHDNAVYRAGERIDAYIDAYKVMKIIIEAERARDESLTKSKRTSSNWQRKQAAARNGSKKAISRKCPLWLAVDHCDHYQQIVGRVRVLRQLFKWALTMGSPSIMKRLHEQGAPAWGGGKGGWHQAYITGLLTNRAVLGEYQPMRRVSIRPFKEVPNGDPVLDLFPQVIDPALFNRVQAARAEGRGSGGRHNNTQANLFQGIAKCAHCDGRMTFNSTRVKGRTVKGVKRPKGQVLYVAKVGYSTLRCDNALRSVRNAFGEFVCSNKTSQRYETLEPVVLDHLLHLAIDPSDFAVEDKCAVLATNIAQTERYLKDKRDRLVNAADTVARTGSRAMETMMLSLESEVEAEEAKLKVLGAELAREHGRVSPEEHLQLRHAMDDEDALTRLHARLLVHQSLRRIIEKIRCHQDGHCVVHIVEGLGLIRIEARGASVKFDLRRKGRDYLIERTPTRQLAVAGYLNRLDEKGF